jgi:prepilin-type N-terminal cleavage/methylation domain-containing protein
MSTSTRRRRSRAFTLVELLVVIGIIAVLIAILMPSLSRARDQARGVQCSSNMRQLIIAAHMFAQDHKGRLPGNHDDALDGAYPNKDPEKRSWLSGDFVNEVYTLANAPETGTLFRYVKDPRLYLCPSRDQHGGKTSGGSYTNARFDYSAVKCLQGARLSSVPNQAEYRYTGRTTTVSLPTPYFVEETSYRIVSQNIDGGWSNVDEHSDHHRGGSYYAALDGSVHFFIPRRKKSDLAEAYQWTAKSPTRGTVTLATYVGTAWGWFDATWTVPPRN